ncbi:hypothetical protein BGZ80_004264 [Entomortierella chlamydospora]|uniref:F-box domain-containing protein n=1 Tax=Entomortierella chlamydospora TaxID=101097 RepID=A0A9P6MMA4_9FUNG|nr:hypothetical protein BGZ79_009537 [Entomortierella chlamydospora]KAG0007757.1 hypothetical protein BGZ80_004264 [Entomortierella chlamydospora]
MSPLQQPHPIELPEIVLHIAQYLEVANTLALYATSKSLRALLAPLVWREVHFGQPATLDLDQEPFVRRIRFKQNQNDDENYSLGVLLENESLIRSLSIYNYASFIPLKLAENCTKLESLTMRGFSSCRNSKEAAEYRDCYRSLMLKQRASLHSLTLLNWVFNPGNIPLPDDPLWNLVSSPSDVQSLRSLTLRHCRVRGRHLLSFYMICQQLEALELVDTEIELSELRSIAEMQGGKDFPTAPQYPRLHELTLQKMSEFRPPQQLELIICECPRLRTLNWDVTSSFESPKREFINYLVSSKWPELDSITINSLATFVTNQDLYRILQSTNQSFRRFDVHIDKIQPATLSLLRKDHFATLQTIDLTSNRDDFRGDWVIEVLTSCPALQVIKARDVTKDEIINAPPWVCLGLRHFAVYIHIGVPESGVNGRYTKEEIQQCRLIFEQLGRLKELRVLDMLTPFIPTRSAIEKQYGNPQNELFYPTSLPLRLKAGLGLLWGLTKLEKVCFWEGVHATPEKELVWMVDHWKRLKQLMGGWRIAKGTAVSVQDKYLWAGKLQEWMEQRGVSTKFCYREEYVLRDQTKVKFEDYCGSSDDEDDGGN